MKYLGRIDDGRLVVLSESEHHALVRLQEATAGKGYSALWEGVEIHAQSAEMGSAFSAVLAYAVMRIRLNEVRARLDDAIKLMEGTANGTTDS